MPFHPTTSQLLPCCPAVTALLLASTLVGACALPTPDDRQAASAPREAGSTEPGNMHQNGVYYDSGGTHRHAPPDNDIGPLLVELEAAWEPARELVEAELDIALDDVSLVLTTDAIMLNEVERETRRLANSQFTSPRFATRFTRQLVDQSNGTYVALYTARQKRILLSRRLLGHYLNSLDSFNDSNTNGDAPGGGGLATTGRRHSSRHSALLSLLIHELVHAADDKRHGTHANRALNFRASFAESATFEGHAQYVTRRICRQEGCLDGLESLDELMFGTARSPNRMMQPVEAISRNVLEYSYVEGERFITALAERENGAALLQTILSEPPTDPIQILAPASYPDTARENRNQRLVDTAVGTARHWQSGNWQMVETSPLKGVNLRADPARREAAIDGFTRLITAMVAMQLYDTDTPDAPPVEISILQTESDVTAELFAESLYRNSILAGALPGPGWYTSTFSSHSSVLRAAGTDWPLTLRRTHVDGTPPYRSTMASAGQYTIQVSAAVTDPAMIENYARRLLSALLDAAT
ncbi:MAG: hypothetical protein CSB44_08195 [Gammaproteobacteria bacterium]|nr:MAG: hypothetical protein CSB44_08195 [Gammaproteobacteria bacterium]